MVYVLRVCVGCAFYVLVLWCVGLCVGAEKTRVQVQKRLRVKVQNASVRAGKNAGMCSTCTRFAGTHRKRLEPTHGDVVNLHTRRRNGVGGGSLLSLVPSLFLLSLSSVVLFIRSLLSLLFSLSNDDNDRSSSQFSVCTHGSDL